MKKVINATQEFKIGKRKIGGNNPAFIVAEVSCNHQQKFEQAVAIIKAAAWAGCDAVKLQTYTPDTITLPFRKPWFMVGGKDNPESWKGGKTFHDLYKEAYTPWEWHAQLQKIAESLGLIFFSTPFDLTAVDFLKKLHVPCFKIASYEATDIPLLKKVAAMKKPVIMSVGFATLPEVEYSVKVLRDGGVRDLAVLQCTTSYDDKERVEATNLRTMQDIRERFNCVAGFSDNMGGIDVPALAVAMGASIIEKHLVVKHDAAIFDDRFSLDKETFKQLVDRIRAVERVMGKVAYGTQTPQEEYNRSFRRSLFVSKDMKKGERFSLQNVRDVRPAAGLETRYLDDVLGKVAKQDIEAGTPLSWKLIK